MLISILLWPQHREHAARAGVPRSCGHAASFVSPRSRLAIGICVWAKSQAITAKIAHHSSKMSFVFPYFFLPSVPHAIQWRNPVSAHLLLCSVCAGGFLGGPARQRAGGFQRQAAPQGSNWKSIPSLCIISLKIFLGIYRVLRITDPGSAARLPGEGRGGG